MFSLLLEAFRRAWLERACGCVSCLHLWAWKVSTNPLGATKPVNRVIAYAEAEVFRWGQVLIVNVVNRNFKNLFFFLRAISCSDRHDRGACVFTECVPLFSHCCQRLISIHTLLICWRASAMAGTAFPFDWKTVNFRLSPSFRSVHPHSNCSILDASVTEDWR